MIRRLRLQCFALLVLLSLEGRADMKAPPSTLSASTPVAKESAAPLSQTYATLWLETYRGGVRRFLRSECPFHPSCSAYSQQAIHEHGLCLGVIMTADRLMRESDDVVRVPHRHVDGRGIRALDPVSANLLDLKRRKSPAR